MLRNAFGNANNEGNFGGESFFDASSGQWGARGKFCLAHKAWIPRTTRQDLRNKDSSSCRSGVLHSIGDIRKNREAKVLLASLLGVCATDNLGT